MKGKVYRRSINPSIHQPRAAAKDLISSGASKHRVLGDKLYRDRKKRRRTSKTRQAKIRIVFPATEILSSDVSSDLSKHQEHAPEAQKGHYIYRM